MPARRTPSAFGSIAPALALWVALSFPAPARSAPDTTPAAPAAASAVQVPPPSPTAPAAPALATPGRLRVMSYNLYNFFDVFDDPYTRDEDTRVKPRREIVPLAQAIRKSNPDVIAVQEVEAEGLLRAFVNDHLGDQGYRHVLVMPTNSDRGGNLGLISRLPIERVSSHRWTDLSLPGDPQSWRYARDVMQVRLRASPKLVIEVFVVHLKSKIDSPSDKNSARWRLSEARGLRALLDERLAAEPDALLCLMGDHNDEPDSPTIRTLTQPTPAGGAGMTDLHSHLPHGQRLTHRSQKYGDSTLDYIFASPALAKRSIRDGARVLEDKELTAGSDHAPILAEFTLE